MAVFIRLIMQQKKVHFDYVLSVKVYEVVIMCKIIYLLMVMLLQM